MKYFYNALKISSLLLLMILVYQPKLIAQEYIPMANEGAHWVVAQNSDEGIIIEFLWEYYINGDTLVDNTLYKKVYRRALVPTMEQPPFTAQEPYFLFGLMRDAPEERKVYAVNFQFAWECPLEEEFLMYNFSLDNGDFVDFCIYIGYGDDTIESISEENLFGMETMVYQTNTFHSYYEGLGSYNGLFEEIFNPYKSINSSQQPYIYYYCPDDESCDLFANIPNMLTSSVYELNIYPNPASNYMIFELPQNTSEVIIGVYNSYGEMIKELISTTNKVQWDFENISSGLYFYDTEIGGTTYRGKIVVQ